MDKQRVFSGAVWEKKFGYCRAVRAGKHIFVSGTAPVAEGGGVHAPGDGYQQARRCFEIAGRALSELGAGFADVVRSRMYVTDISRSADFGRAHAEYLGANPPATAMIEVKALIDPAMLIEIELDAILP